MIYPIIYGNGDISEIEIIEGKGEYLQGIGGVVYKKETFASSLDKSRVAYVEVYIDERFMGDIRESERMAVITKYINDNAAWLFSYGKRRNLEFDSPIVSSINYEKVKR